MAEQCPNSLTAPDTKKKFIAASSLAGLRSEAISAFGSKTCTYTGPFNSHVSPLPNKPPLPPTTYYTIPSSAYMSSPGNLSGCVEATTSRLSLLGLAGKHKSVSDPPGFKISVVSKTPNTREFILDMLDHKAYVIILHKLVQSVPRGYVTDFMRARLREHELESRLLKSRASHVEQLALLRQKHSRAVLEREMYQHANKLSFPSTATIPSRGRVQWKTTATDNALCWALDAHGKQAVVVVVDLVLNGDKSAHHTKVLQSIYLRACWDEHELESEIRVSSSRCSWDKQSRLLRLKHARATAEINCYDVVIFMEQPSASHILSPLQEEVDDDREMDESDGYFSDESLPSSE